jgi:hypothetical protein
MLFTKRDKETATPGSQPDSGAPQIRPITLDALVGSGHVVLLKDMPEEPQIGRIYLKLGAPGGRGGTRQRVETTSPFSPR